MTMYQGSGLSMNTLWYADRTFGMAASAGQIERTLSIVDALDAVPKEGTVLNLGSGIYLAINGLIQRQRPDVQLISVDSGYRFDPPTSDIDESEPTEHFTGADRAALASDTRWYKNAVAAVAEQLPFRDNTFDFIFSHAGIPDNMCPESESYEAAARETARVLKVGGLAVLGPFVDYNTGPEWQEAAASLAEAGIIESANTHDKAVYIAGWDRTIQARVTEIRK